MHLDNTYDNTLYNKLSRFCSTRRLFTEFQARKRAASGAGGPVESLENLAGGAEAPEGVGVLRTNWEKLVEGPEIYTSGPLHGVDSVIMGWCEEVRSFVDVVDSGPFAVETSSSALLRGAS